MSNHKGILALEGQEEEVEVIVAVGDEHPALDTETIAETVEEATDINEAVGGIADVIEAADGEVSPETTSVAKIAIEHFCKRLGYSGQLLASLESFGTSKEANKETLGHLRTAHAEVGKRISLLKKK